MKKFLALFTFALLLALAVTESFAAAPTIQAKNLTFSNIGTEGLTVTFTKGNGAQRIVVAAEATEWDDLWNPVDGEEYEIDDPIGDAWVVYVGTGRQAIVSGLTPGFPYIFKVFEYNGTDVNTEYLLANASNNPRATITYPEPPVGLEVTTDGEYLGDRWFSIIWDYDFESPADFEYDLQVATDEAFTNILPEYYLYNIWDVGYLTDGYFVVGDDVNQNTQYFWRMRTKTTNYDITPWVSRVSPWAVGPSVITRPEDAFALDPEKGCPGEDYEIAIENIGLGYTWSIYDDENVLVVDGLAQDETWTAEGIEEPTTYWIEWVSENDLSSLNRWPVFIDVRETAVAPTSATVDIEEYCENDMPEFLELTAIGGFNSDGIYHWYSGSCVGEHVITADEPSVFIDAPTETTTYYCIIEEATCPAEGFTECVSVTVTVTPAPEVEAGEDQELCADVTEVFLDGSGENVYEYEWFSEGDGEFEDVLDPLTTYYPGVEDIENGSVILWLTAFGNGTCEETEDFVTLYFRELPWADAGEDQDLCKSEPFIQLSGAIGGYGVEGATWTGGEGTYDPDEFTLDAYYIPTAEELEAGFVTFTLTTNTTGEPCSTYADDEVTFYFLDNPDAPIAVDNTVCWDGEEHTADVEELLGYGVNWWTQAVGGDPTTKPTGTEAGVYTAWAENQMLNSPFCVSERTLVTLTINPLPEMDCPDDFAVCIDAEAFELTGATPEGGVYEGAGVTDNEFYASVAGVGTHEITYTFEDENGCVNYCTFNITVNPLPEVECPEGFGICANDIDVQLNGTGENPEGGVFSGEGVYEDEGDYFFSPSDVGEGVYEITYTYTDGNFCSNSCTFEIEVYGLPDLGDAEIVATPEAACEGTSVSFEVTGDYYLGYEGEFVWYVNGEEAGTGTTLDIEEITEDLDVEVYIEAECDEVGPITSFVTMLVTPTPDNFLSDHFDIYEGGDITLEIGDEYDADVVVWQTSFDEGETWEDIIGNPSLTTLEIEDATLELNNAWYRVHFINELGENFCESYSDIAILHVYAAPEDCPTALEFYNGGETTLMAGEDLNVSWTNTDNGSPATGVLVVYAEGIIDDLDWDFIPVNGTEYPHGEIDGYDGYFSAYFGDYENGLTIADEILANTNYTAYVYYFNGENTGVIYGDCWASNFTRYIAFDEIASPQESAVAFEVNCVIVDRQGLALALNPTVTLGAFVGTISPASITDFVAGVKTFNATVTTVDGSEEQYIYGTAPSYIPFISNEFVMYPTAPTAQAINLSLVGRGTDWIQFNWAAAPGAADGTKDGRIVLVRQGNPIENPVKGTTYNAAAADYTDPANPFATWATGDFITNTTYKTYVMFDEVGPHAISSFRINGMDRNPSRTYYFKVFEYNNGGGNPNLIVYNTSAASFNPRTWTLNAHENAFAGVEIDGLAGKSFEGKAKLSWNSFTELGNVAFELYRQSENSDVFELVGSVEGLNKDAGKAYSFVDANGLTVGDTYLYKLVSVSLDGTREDLDEKFVTILSMPYTDANMYLNNVTNPVQNSVSFDVELSADQNTTIQIADMSGRIIATLNNGFLKSGVNTFKYDMNGNAAGTYFIMVNAGTEAAMHPFVYMP